MEAAQAIISSLYTNFLLRDFAGKIVPGGIVLLSTATLFWRPSQIAKFVEKAPIVVIVFLVGISWTLMFGLQSVAERVGLWRYFPDGNPDKFIHNQIKIARFLRIACAEEKFQYERFVAIKEACGNLFFACLVTFIPLSYYFLRTYLINYLIKLSKRKTEQWKPIVIRTINCIIVLYEREDQWIRAVIFMLIVATSGYGLHRMYSYHVNWQFDYATVVTVAAVSGGFLDGHCANAGGAKTP